jgi:hypothetical protein
MEGERSHNLLGSFLHGASSAEPNNGKDPSKKQSTSSLAASQSSMTNKTKQASFGAVNKTDYRDMTILG